MKKTDFGQQVRDECRRRGWIVNKVESYNACAMKSSDLFGFGDYLAVTDDGPDSLIVIIQTCRRSDMAARRYKIQVECGKAHRMLYNAGAAIVIWGWYREKSEEHPDGFLVPEGTKRHGNQKWFLLEEEVPYRRMCSTGIGNPKPITRLRAKTITDLKDQLDQVYGPDPILDAGSP